MPFTQKFILAWMIFLLVLAFGSWAYNQHLDRKARAALKEMEPTMPSLDEIVAQIFPDFKDVRMNEADAWCRQHIKNTANFHRANRYYHDL